MRLKSHSEVGKTEEFFHIWYVLTFCKIMLSPQTILWTTVADSVSHVQKLRYAKEKTSTSTFPIIKMGAFKLLRPQKLQCPEKGLL